jgi:hypothetical protein
MVELCLFFYQHMLYTEGQRFYQPGMDPRQYWENDFMDSKTTRLLLGLGLLGVVGFVIYKMSATTAPKPVVAAGGSSGSGSASTAAEITAAGGALSDIFAQLTPTDTSSTG